MSLRWRILALVLTVAAVVAAVGVGISRSLLRADRAGNAEVTEFLPASDSARDLLAGLIDQQTALRGYLITGDRTVLAPYYRGVEEVDRELAAIERLLGDDAEVAAELAEVEESLQTWRQQTVEAELAAGGQATMTEARELVRAGQLTFDRLRNDVDNLQTLIQERLDAVGDARSDAEDDVVTALVLGAGALLVVAVVWTFLLLRWVVRPTRRLQQAMRRVAAGDLTASVQVSGPPEIRAVSRDAEAMRLRILAELEEARAAREALEQRGPVVAGLREQLQPSRLPVSERLRVAGALYPAEGVLAGDWYDVVTRPAGSVALVLADVSGHGAEAGLIAAQLKHVLLAGLQAGQAPADALALVAQGFGANDERFASCLIVDVHPETGEGCYVNAGHPPALVIDCAETGESRSVSELEPTGPLLSSLGGSWATGELRLGPDELLLAFTDGLIEARSAKGEEFGQARILAAVHGCSVEEPERAVHQCVTAAQGFARHSRRDDLTIVALSVPGAARTEPADRGRATFAVPSQPGLAEPTQPPTANANAALPLAGTPADAGRSRSFLRAVAAGRLDADQLETAVLLTSELVANVARHARTTCALQVTYSGDSVRVAVTDSDPRLPLYPPGDPDPDAESGRGLLLVDALADQWGVELVGGGKLVWFELPAARPRASVSGS